VSLSNPHNVELRIVAAMKKISEERADNGKP
jgi:hypothetical protein